MATDISERASRPATMTDPLRVDQVIDSRHKYVSATSHVVTVEHAGEELQLMLPDHCPACDFLVTSAVDDWLFLIGRWRPSHDGENYAGAVVVARRQEDGVYATELWHETYRSFVMRASLGTSD